MYGAIKMCFMQLDLVPFFLFVRFLLFICGIYLFFPPLLAVTRRESLTTPYNLSQDGFLVRPGWRVLPSLFFSYVPLFGSTFI